MLFKNNFIFFSIEIKYLFTFVCQDHKKDAKYLDFNSSISSAIIDDIRQEFRDEMEKCEDANRVEHEKLKTKLTNLEICLLTMECKGIRKVIISTSCFTYRGEL